jgi:hypothetical protein
MGFAPDRGRCGPTVEGESSKKEVGNTTHVGKKQDEPDPCQGGDRFFSGEKNVGDQCKGKELLGGIDPRGRREGCGNEIEHGAMRKSFLLGYFGP